MEFIIILSLSFIVSAVLVMRGMYKADEYTSGRARIASRKRWNKRRAARYLTR